MIKSHYGRPLSAVEPKITQALYKKCGGHPFFSMQLISAMKETGSEHLTVDPATQMLVIRTRNFDLKNLLVDDVQTAVMTRFDKLQPEFQRILKTAAMMGQIFDLDDLLGVLGDENLTFEQLESRVKEYDTQGFLSCVADSDDSSIRGGERSQYGFQNILIVSTIVQSMSLQQRNLLHEKIAEVSQAY
jgi:predicted ATPase